VPFGKKTANKGTLPVNDVGFANPVFFLKELFRVIHFVITRQVPFSPVGTGVARQESIGGKAKVKADQAFARRHKMTSRIGAAGESELVFMVQASNPRTGQRQRHEERNNPKPVTPTTTQLGHESEKLAHDWIHPNSDRRQQNAKDRITPSYNRLLTDLRQIKEDDD
jgi:hypothetical protein